MRGTPPRPAWAELAALVEARPELDGVGLTVLLRPEVTV